jgi:hypothetical protein
MLTPSFLAHVLNGLCFLVIIIIVVSNYYAGKKQNMELISLILLLSIAIGVHGISHLLQEVYYGWNPLN